mgnify:CR=1 FL=1
MLNPRSKCASGLQGMTIATRDNAEVLPSGMTVLQIPMNLSWGLRP